MTDVKRDSVGRYRITGTLGQGGMGVVYAAVDERLGRPLAVKMVRTASTDPHARERLYREARVAAGINHPAICQLYEIDEHDGDIFIAMELLQGESLAARLARGPLPLSEAASIALGILDGIDALHRHGVVHRDLKPSNVFLTPHGVKILDFGLATAAADAGTDTTVKLTAPGTILGTPQYSAPEQLTGGPVDRRTDIFAAGVMIYEMLTASPPFGGTTTVQIFHAIVHEPAPVLVGGPAVAAVDRVLHRALAKKPEARYQSASEMARDLREALAQADSGPIQGARPITRLVVLPLRVLRADPETDFLAFSLADAVTSSLSGLQSLVVRSPLAAKSTGEIPDLKTIAAQADVDMMVAGTLIRAGDQVRVSTQLVEAASGTVLWSHTAQASVADLFGLQDDLTRRIVESLSLPLSAREQRMLKRDVPSTAQAYEYYLRANELSRTGAGWTAARELYSKCVAEDPHYAPAWARLGRVHRLIAKYVEQGADENFSRAEAALKRALELNPDLSLAENLYAHLEVDLGRSRGAMVRLLERASLRSADPELYAGLVHVCRYVGLLGASLAAFEQARRLDPAIATSVAHTFFLSGDYERVQEFSVEEVPYIRSVALMMLGRDSEAREMLRDIEARFSNRVVYYSLALQELLDGRIEESAATIRLPKLRDPEGRFYAARHLARLGETEEPIEMLASVVSGGFYCYPAMTRDPWLDPLRGDPRFTATLRKAEELHREARIAFLQAGGDRILSVKE
jgi:serine/threonine protein kinase/tetratricopeptide (TPR) repeat protein